MSTHVKSVFYNGYAVAESFSDQYLCGRIECLLELAFLSLQLKEQFMVEKCVKELKSIDDTVSKLNANCCL